MSRFLALALCAIVAQSFLAPRPADGAEVAIAEATFAQGVDRDSKKPQRPLAAAAYGGAPPLFFWTRIRGDRSAFERLVADGKLPIRHVWTRRVGSASAAERQLAENELDALAVSLSERIDTAITDGAVLRKLGIEVSANGNFDFRTWTKKENLGGGVYEVSVFYRDGSRVDCGDGPCRFRICRNVPWCGQ